MTQPSWRDKQGDIWTYDPADGLLHTPETMPFSKERVEQKWGPLVPIAAEPEPYVPIPAPNSKNEGDPGTWSHCGKSRPHPPHVYTFAMNEGPYTVQCNGTSLPHVQLPDGIRIDTEPVVGPPLSILDYEPPTKLTVTGTGAPTIEEIADRLEAGDTVSIPRRAIKSAVLKELQRRNEERAARLQLQPEPPLLTPEDENQIKADWTEWSDLPQPNGYPSRSEVFVAGWKARHARG